MENIVNPDGNFQRNAYALIGPQEETNIYQKHYYGNSSHKEVYERWVWDVIYV